MSKCGDCQGSWTGTTKAHCVTCHETFASNSVSDLHWVGRRCANPATVIDANGARKLTKDDEGTWQLVGIRHPAPAPLRKRARGDMSSRKLPVAPRRASKPRSAMNSSKGTV
jgi:hypothetical protein